MGFVLTFPGNLNVLFAPAVGVAVAAVVFLVLRQGYRKVAPNGGASAFLPFALLVAAALGAWGALLVTGEPGSKLYLSWAVSCLLAGIVGLALYRGLYVYMRQRSRSPLIMLVASLGILLAITAATTSCSRARRGHCRTSSEARRGPSPGPTSKDSTCSPSAWRWQGSWGCCYCCG